MLAGQLMKNYRRRTLTVLGSIHNIANECWINQYETAVLFWGIRMYGGDT